MGINSTVIRPTKRLLNLRLREIWGYRELLYFLIWRDIKVRYKQTLLGASWAVLQPLLFMVVFSIFLGRIAGVSSEGVPYPLFSFTALVPWTFFSQALNGASQSVVGSSNLVSKVYFPRLIVPIAAAASFFIDFVIAFGVLLLIGVYYGVYPTIQAVWVPLFTLLAFFAALAVGVWLAALNVRFRDVKYAVPFLIQLWLFASPVAYSITILPERWRTIAGLNPLAGVVQGFRWSLLDIGSSPQGIVAVSALVTIALFLGGVVYFQKVERTFADVI